MRGAEGRVVLSPSSRRLLGRAMTDVFVSLCVHTHTHTRSQEGRRARWGRGGQRKDKGNEYCVIRISVLSYKFKMKWVGKVNTLMP